ncbi:MAG: autotransporter outer membrane beta-barrel domain-containing protein, partial [Methylophilaceae bacterium]
NAKSLRQAIESASTGSSSDSAALTALNDALVVINGKSATDDTALAKQVAPQDDMISGSTLASKAVTGTVQGIISNRMASLRSGDAYYGMGMSAGNMTAKSGFIQAFGSEVEQKNKTVGSGTQYGYESSSAGFALGFDGTTDTGATVGLSFSMSNTDLDGKGTGKAKNDIDSYTASLYWDKTGQNGYVEGSLTYGLNENKTSRLVNTAGLSRTYTGSYDSNQVSLSLGGGAPNAVGASGYVTPFIGVTGTYIKTDAYTETSNTSGDNLRLRVAQDDVNSLVGKVGVKYHNVTDKGTPMISLSLNNEFGDDTINSTNTYQGGGSSFTTSTDVEPLSATLGLGYSYGSDTASIEFAYEAEANDDKYLGHYGSIKIVGKF